MPIGIQDFQKLREDGFVYVDKTELVYKLVQNSCPYFLSRPRRFGKSLLVTTLEAYFKGRKELFEGLAIMNDEKEWAEYPVLKFSLAGGEFTSGDGLRTALNKALKGFEDAYGLPQGDAGDLPGRFKDALGNAKKKMGRRVAVLVDEYDNPLLKAFGENPEQEKANRDLFKSFFAVLKDCDGDTRFVLFTGVTKFSKMSIFSDLNQLQDISMNDGFAGICGITQDELERDFSPEIDALAQENGMTREECLARLKKQYDGYHFTEKSPDIYNPFSLINAFNEKKIESYWFESGTPTFLVRRLKAMNFNPKSLSDGSLYTTKSAVKDYRPDNPDIVPLLYQSGYLTIKAYDDRRKRLTLGYPNDEVKYGFTASLAPEYLHSPGGRTGADIFAIDDAVEDGDMDLLREQFTALFARLPYVSGSIDDTMLERDFQNVIFLTFLLLGQFVQVEQHSAKGRADCIVETDKYVYIFEFKRDGSADEALAQIEAAGYAAPYSADSRTLVKIGAVFSSEQKNISEWKVVGL